MSKPLTLNVPDDIFVALDSEARTAGVSIHEWVIDVLTHRVTPTAVRPSADRDAALARLLQHLGTIEAGDPDGANNDAIDRDLADEYESTHEPN